MRSGVVRGLVPVHAFGPTAIAVLAERGPRVRGDRSGVGARMMAEPAIALDILPRAEARGFPTNYGTAEAVPFKDRGMTKGRGAAQVEGSSCG